MATNHLIERSCDECGKAHKQKQTAKVSCSRIMRADVYEPYRPVIVEIDLCQQCADRILEVLPNMKEKLIAQITRR